MSANVETMFSVRETPWHGLGRIVMDAPASREALELAGLDWQVESRNIYSGTGAMIPGYRANVRSTDDAVLGVPTKSGEIIEALAQVFTTTFLPDSFMARILFSSLTLIYGPFFNERLIVYSINQITFFFSQ